MNKIKNNVEVDTTYSSPLDEDQMNTEDENEENLVEPSVSGNVNLVQPDLDPNNKKWKMAKTTIHQQRNKAYALQKSIKRVRKKVDNISMLFKFLMENDLVSDTGKSVIQAVLKD